MINNKFSGAARNRLSKLREGQQEYLTKGRYKKKEFRTVKEYPRRNAPGKPPNLHERGRGQMIIPLNIYQHPGKKPRVNYSNALKWQ